MKMHFITYFFKQIRCQIICFMLIILNLCLTTSGFGQVDEKYTIKTVVIDAGHGGKDSGARGRKAYEKDIALYRIYIVVPDFPWIGPASRNREKVYHKTQS